MPKSRFKHCSLFVQSDIVCFEWQGHVPVSQFVPMNVGGKKTSKTFVLD